MSVCNQNKTLDEKELEILRHAVDIAEERAGKRVMNSTDIIKLIDIVENFIRSKKLICYGGTAINNILPEKDQFYNKDIEIPDYDFFSYSPLEHAKQLADIYYKNGYKEVEAKAGQHYGTYKVFVNFIPVADITLMETKLFKNVYKETIIKEGIAYAPPNFLRMSMYLELSRPNGDISRWEKVLKRLQLLNKNYPLNGENCKKYKLQHLLRPYEDKTNESQIYNIVKSKLISMGVVFIGGYACSLYNRYMEPSERIDSNIPDFDVLSENPNETALSVKTRLHSEGIKNVKVQLKTSLGEIIPSHYEIIVNGKTIAYIYEPAACYSYNVLNVRNTKIKIASIDTLLSLYLAFLYVNRPHYDKNRILCMAEYLFNVQSKNRLNQKGLLRRFSVDCYGEQMTKEDILGLKAEKFKELQNKQNTREYNEWFFKYVPSSDKKEKVKNRKTIKNKNRLIPKKQTKKGTRRSRDNIGVEL
jgi:hypothetical protein